MPGLTNSPVFTAALQSPQGRGGNRYYSQQFAHGPVNPLVRAESSGADVYSPSRDSVSSRDNPPFSPPTVGAVGDDPGDLSLALRPAPPPPLASAANAEGALPSANLAVLPPVAAEVTPVRTLARPIKRVPLSERVASHPAYIGLWEAIRTNDAQACTAHLQALEDLDSDVLHHTLTHEVLDLGAFSAANAPEGSAWVEGQPLPPAAACDAYALIVDRAKPYAEEEASTKMGPGRPASIAAALGHTKALEAMLGHDVNICNLSEVVVLGDQKVLHTTPAFWAAYFGHAECLQLLQGYGISVSAVREAIALKARPATVKWLGAAKNDRQAKPAFERAMRAAIDRARQECSRDGALEDIQTLIDHGKLLLDSACDVVPSGWLAVALVKPERSLPVGLFAAKVGAADLPWQPAYAAAELMLRAGAPLQPLGPSNEDFLQLSLRSGEQSLIATFLERNAALRKRQLPGGAAPLAVAPKHFMAAIDSEAPQPTMAQLLLGGYAPKTSDAALRLYEAAYRLELTRITEILQIEYRLLKDREGRAFAHLSTHQAMSDQGLVSYQARRARLLAQCQRDEPTAPFDQKFSGDAHRDLNANLDAAPVHAWWGLRPVCNAAKAFGVFALDQVVLATSKCCCCFGSKNNRHSK